jgi:adenine-specific DNA-methyltransferase
MPNLEITKPELVWPGKYDANGQRVVNRGAALPFQVVETIAEGKATRQSGSLGDLFSHAQRLNDTENWHNKLIWGDNLLVMASLLKDFAGKIDLIYIDPPFATGADFSFSAQVGEGDDTVGKAPSSIEEKAYRDTWGRGTPSYLCMMVNRLCLLRDLLNERGSLFVHCDWHVGHLLRCVLDETMAADKFVNEIVWYYYNKFQGNVNHFACNHDVVFWYRKTDDFTFIPQKEKRAEGAVRQIRRRWDGETGRIVNVKGDDGKVVYQETDERAVDDVWRLSMLQPADKTENRGYPTQKPESLLERIVRACSNEGDLVADFFCGSGTMAAVAEKLGRRWIACDLGRYAIHTTRKRLLEIPDCKPFQILNLGKYERQHWAGAEFSDADQQRMLGAYIGFILALYQAQPAPGAHIHGRKAGALVHVGAVDAPVTIAEVNAALAECATLKRDELHVLGWEWEMGMNDPIIKHAKAQYGIRLRLLAIPREVMEKQAVDRGDVRFFDLAYLDAAVAADDKAGRAVHVELKDFIIPDTDLIPEEVRTKISKWSDYIDYWAVDWDFQNDTFMNQWQAYRTRKERKLELTSAAHTYEQPGKVRILIKVVDIFGNDTSRLLEHTVR